MHLRVSASSFERVKSTYDNHIVNSSIGNMKLKQIQQNDIQQFLNEKKHLSTSSLNKIKQLLNGAFKLAIRNNLIRINPIIDVTPPKSDVKQKDIEILTIEEQKAYIDALWHENYESSI